MSDPSSQARQLMQEKENIEAQIVRFLPVSLEDSPR
jgi:hypothetical protein